MNRLPLLLLALAACDRAPRCADSPADLPRCVSSSAWGGDTTWIARARPPGSDHWQAVQDRCAERFRELGLEVERHDYGSGVNVLGTLPGEVSPDEWVLVTAHYDSVEECPGADDNASGVAGVLEAARVLTMGRYERTLVFACWDEEELGLKGARAWAEEARAADRDIVTVFNFEMIGYRDTAPDSQAFPPGLDLFFPDEYEEVEDNGFRGDFVAVVGDERSREAMAHLETHGEALGLPVLPLELETDQTTSGLFLTLQRSDHAAFWYADYPAMMITDTSEFRYAAYHCEDGEDSWDKLDAEFATAVTAATVAAAAATAGLR